MVQDQTAISLYILDFITKEINTIHYKSNWVSEIVFITHSSAEV
jgi:hypothetical protein